VSKKTKNKKTSSVKEAVTTSQLTQQAENSLQSFWKREFVFLIPALLLSIIVYLNVLNGAFVYDDLRQIVRNTLIQDSSLFWQALTSDVWAAKGGTAVSSNYWRPTFVVWLIFNFKLFGTDSTVGWHITNILLNSSVVTLAYFLLRRLKLSQMAAGAIVLIFAAHPVHVESVAWISGSPDLLMGVFLLASLLLVDFYLEKKKLLFFILSLIFYALALGAKEVAILFPLIVFVLTWKEENFSLKDSIKISAPFVILALIYFFLRLAVIGQFSQTPVEAIGISGAILSLPSVFAFYIRQIVFPYWIGPSYSLRHVTLQNLGVVNFLLPLIISVFALFALVKIGLRSRAGRMGLAVFFLLLLPAMNISVFLPEQFAHDRYLYLPLLGFLMIALPILAEKINEKKIFVAICLLCLPFALQTYFYNQAWLSNLSLWEWGTKTDPNSSSNFMQLGAVLFDLKRYTEAKQAYDKSIEIKANADALMGRGRVLTEQRRYAEAEKDFQSVLLFPVEILPTYTLYQTYESFAVCYERQGKLNEAANLLAQARNRLPQYSAALTEKLAIVLYIGGQKEEALKQLEKYRQQARVELLPESRFVIYRLGLLYAESGRKAEAREAFQEFLTLTKNVQDEETKKARTEAETVLKKLDLAQKSANKN